MDRYKEKQTMSNIAFFFSKKNPPKSVTKHERSNFKEEVKSDRCPGTTCRAKK